MTTPGGVKFNKIVSFGNVIGERSFGQFHAGGRVDGNRKLFIDALKIKLSFFTNTEIAHFTKTNRIAKLLVYEIAEGRQISDAAEFNTLGFVHFEELQRGIS
jgi:hypothetical protein